MAVDGSDTSNELASAEVAERLALHGPNALPEPRYRLTVYVDRVVVAGPRVLRLL